MFDSLGGSPPPLKPPAFFCFSLLLNVEGVCVCGEGVGGCVGVCMGGGCGCCGVYVGVCVCVGCVGVWGVWGLCAFNLFN